MYARVRLKLLERDEWGRRFVGKLAKRQIASENCKRKQLKNSPFYENLLAKWDSYSTRSRDGRKRMNRGNKASWTCSSPTAVSRWSTISILIWARRGCSAVWWREKSTAKSFCFLFPNFCCFCFCFHRTDTLALHHVCVCVCEWSVNADAPNNKF